jgi:hypothetical protein
MSRINDPIGLVKEYGGITAAAKAIGVPYSTFHGAYTKAGGAGRKKGEHAKPAKAESVVTKTEPPSEGIEVVHEKNATVVTCKSTTIRTLEEALAAAEVDLSVWEVESYTANKWDMAAKTSTRKVGKEHWVNDLSAIELWQVKVKLKRKLPKPIADAIAELVKVQYIPQVYKQLPLVDKHLLEISLYDTHFGKLCWGPETGNSYDLKTSKTYYLNAVERLLGRVSGYPIDRILLPIGNDFFHINNWINTTAKGTIQDVDSRMSKIFEVGCSAVIQAIDRCLTIAPVDVLWIPGNHDPETSWFMAKFVEAWYRDMPMCRVNTDPMWRKYVHYGCTLLGYAHGNEEKEADLPNLMATEQPQLWARSTCRGWRLGHFHTKRTRKYTAGDTINGVTVDYLPSISGTDAWHFRKGYVGNPKAAEAWLWSEEEGYVGQFSVRV